MNTEKATQIMKDMAEESRNKVLVIGLPMGCMRLFENNKLRLYVTTNCGERWSINGVMKSKAKALEALKLIEE